MLLWGLTAMSHKTYLLTALIDRKQFGENLASILMEDAYPALNRYNHAQQPHVDRTSRIGWADIFRVSGEVMAHTEGSEPWDGECAVEKRHPFWAV